MLHLLQYPGAFWMDERPIVVPVGPLLPEHLEPIQASPYVIRVCDDKRLGEVPDRPSTTIHPDYDLTR